MKVLKFLRIHPSHMLCDIVYGPYDMKHMIWDIFQRIKAMRNNQLNPNSFRPSIIKSEQDQTTEETVVGQTPATPPPRQNVTDDVDIVDPVETTSPVTIQNVNNTGDDTTAPSTSGLNRSGSTGSLTGSPSKRRKSSESNPRTSPPIRSVTPIEHIANPNPESPGMHLKFCIGVTHYYNYLVNNISESHPR